MGTRLLQYRFGGYSSCVELGSEALLERFRGERAVVVWDENTSSLLEPLHELPSVILPPGERTKSLDTVTQLLERFLEEGLERDATVIAVGGGVVCDAAALAASLYMRGVRLVLIPTTLLAMVDAALGGKTGVNFSAYKNLVGTFYPAEQIIVVPETLETLPQREYLSGLAEVIKSAMLGDPELFRILTKKVDEVLAREREVVEDLILRSVAVKGQIVEQDFTERGGREWLNLGHTFAHALESVTGFEGWTHGEAVAWGIVQALRCGEAAGITDPDYAATASELFRQYGFRCEIDTIAVDALIDAMQRDKKNRGGRVRYVLQRRPGETELRELSSELVRSVLSRNLS